MTTPDLAAIEARWAAATPGPWESTGTDEGDWLVKFPPGHDNSVIDIWFGDMESNTGQDIANADAIAHAPTDIAALIAALRASEEARGRLEVLEDRLRQILLLALEGYDAIPADTVLPMAALLPLTEAMRAARRALQGEEAGNG